MVRAEIRDTQKDAVNVDAHHGRFVDRHRAAFGTCELSMASTALFAGVSPPVQASELGYRLGG